MAAGDIYRRGRRRPTVLRRRRPGHQRGTPLPGRRGAGRLREPGWSPMAAATRSEWWRA